MLMSKTLAGILLCINASAATLTYDFSGELVSLVNDTTVVEGNFTLDTMTAAITDYEFTSPVPFGGFASVTPIVGTDPSADFVVMVIEGPFGVPYMYLMFQRPCGGTARQGTE
jgi:hypothetical protein